MAHDVFISHSHEDKTIADMVCAGLEQQDVRCWMAPRDIQLGADWGSAIVAAIRGSRLMVLVFSDHANASRHIPRELERAIDLEIPIIPFRIENVAPRGSLEYNLSSVHWLDAVTPPVEAHIKRLGQTLRARLGDRPAIAVSIVESPAAVVPLAAPSVQDKHPAAGAIRAGPGAPEYAQGGNAPRSADRDRTVPLGSAERPTRSSRRPALLAVGVLVAALCAIAAYTLLSGGRGSGRGSAATGSGRAALSGQTGTASKPTSVALPDSPVPAPPSTVEPSGRGTAATTSASSNGSKAPAGGQPASQPKPVPPAGSEVPKDAAAAAKCARLNERASLGEPLTSAEQTFLTRQCRD
jgi:hypothetical protein